MEKAVKVELESLHIENLSKELSHASIDAHTKIPYETREHITLAISPGNQYFTRNTVCTLVRWVYNEFKKVTFLDVTDIYKYTLEAKESKRINNTLKKKAKDFEIKFKYALQQSLDNCSDDNIEEVYQEIKNSGQHMKFWKNKLQICQILDFYNNEGYCTSLKAIQEAFKQDTFFKQTCLDFTTNKILANKKDPANFTENHKLVGVKYLLHELPFLINGNEIFGCPSVMFYHKPFDIFYQILNGDFPSLTVTSNSGIFVVNLRLEENATIELQEESYNSSLNVSSVSPISARNSESFIQKELRQKQHVKKRMIEKEIQNYFAPLGERMTKELECSIEKDLNKTVAIEFGPPAKISIDDSKIIIWVEKLKNFNLMVKLYGDTNNYKSVIEKSLTKFLGSTIGIESRKTTKINFKSTRLLEKLDTQEISKIIAKINEAT